MSLASSDSELVADYSSLRHRRVPPALPVLVDGDLQYLILKPRARPPMAPKRSLPLLQQLSQRVFGDLAERVLRQFVDLHETARDLVRR